MNDDKKEGCCGGGSPESAKGKCGCGCGCCCGAKKIIIKLLILGLVFAAGMWFAKACPLGQSMCPMSGTPK